jgi:PAS domain S-box-containing protein
MGESQHTLRSELEHVGDAILMIDTSGTVQTWTSEAERLLGYSASEAIGQPLTERHLAEIQEVLATGEERYEATEWWVRRDGSRFWAQVTARPVVDVRGALHGYAVVVRDLSDQLHAPRAPVLAEPAS